MTTMGVSDLFIDTNVLIYATDPRSPLQHTALDALQQARDAGTALVISPQIVREFLAAATRQNVGGGGIPLDDILENIATFRAEFRIVEDSPTALDNLIALARQIPMAGRQIHDANIVATMLTHSIQRLLTHNTADFARFAHLITILPLV